MRLSVNRQLCTNEHMERYDLQHCIVINIRKKNDIEKKKMMFLLAMCCCCWSLFVQYFRVWFSVATPTPLLAICRCPQCRKMVSHSNPVPTTASKRLNIVQKSSSSLNLSSILGNIFIRSNQTQSSCIRFLFLVRRSVLTHSN